MANEFNKKFIEKFFPNETIGENYPKTNYRLRLAGLTTFEPYFSEASKLSSETDSEYNARVNTSGKFYEEQEILLNDVVNSDINVSGLSINSEYKDGKIPETLLFLEKCILSDDEKTYTVYPVNLNDKDFVTANPPAVVYPIGEIPPQGDSNKKGWYVYRKTSAVQKQNDKLTEIQSGWNKVHEFSSEDIHAVGIDEEANVARRFIDIGESGFSGWTNELFTEYKILDSGLVEVAKDDSHLKEPRVINHPADPGKAYTIERKVTRESNLTQDNPATWEIIDTAATFPYKDSEIFSDTVTKNIDFEIEGVYDVVPTGSAEDTHTVEKDFFEVDLIEDWGKSEKKDYTFGQETKDLIFKSGESLRVTQKGVSFFSQGLNEQHDIMGTVEMAFSPSTTGVSGSITGENNYKNFYELEYQFVPEDRSSKKLYYAKPQVSNGSIGVGTVSVGDSVFLNTGIKEDGAYDEIEIDVHGNSIAEVDEMIPALQDSVNQVREEYYGPTINSGIFYSLEPQEVVSFESSGIGYSEHTSGEMYLTVPKGGYNSIDSEQGNALYSAGETRVTFYQGGQNYGSEDSHYALTEYRTFDSNANTDEQYYYQKPKQIRISEDSLCLGQSASELGDRDVGKTKILDYDYESRNILRNANLFGIDASDGSIKISNLKSTKEDFERKTNLFFEKNYVGELTILATGQNPEKDLNLLKDIVREAKASELGDSTVFYLERDIYIDSDNSTQANNYSPSVFSSKQGQALSPFSINPSTRNPEALGEEKLYMTQVYQKPHISQQVFPFKDPSYFLLNNEVRDEFHYSNNSNYEITDIDLVNTDSVYTYQPDNFRCSLVNNRVSRANEAIGVLSYDGISVTGEGNASDPLTFAGSTAGERSITIKNPTAGVYYEIQAKDGTSDWSQVCPALEALDSSSLTVNLKNSTFNNPSSNLKIRALEWTKSRITTNKTNIRTVNESADSLILKSKASNSIYDWSKFEHKIDNVNEDDSNNPHVTTTSDTVSGTSVQAMVFDAGDKLDLGSHRSFNILKGNFSLDFWIKPNGSQDKKIITKSGVIEVSMKPNHVLEFKISGQDAITWSALTNDTWHHVAISATFNKSTKQIDLKLFVDGKEKTNNAFEFNDLEAKNNKSLVIGDGFIGRLYNIRLYVGKSNEINGTFAKPSPPVLEKEANPRSYKLLRFLSRREVVPGNWITNKNSFNNVAPPNEYKENTNEEDTYHMGEWLASSSESDNLSVSSSRAMINYIRGYAYQAPNNPHINKNYEGSPITSISDIDRIRFESYKYKDGAKDAKKDFLAAPYLYEDVAGEDIGFIRSNIKGGNYITSRDDIDRRAFSAGSRLRITKYVYKIYTKNAVLIGDLGTKDSYSSQRGWDYELQYSLNSGTTWSDVEPTSTSVEQRIFYNNDYTENRADSFNNIQVVNSIPYILMRTDITRKYRPEEIEFRIKKKQNIELENDLTKVIKKINFLPLDVTMPTSQTLVNITQQASDTVIDSAGDAVVTLDPTREYYLIKNTSENIYKDLVSELKIETLQTNVDGDVVSSESSLTSKPISLAGLTGVRIRKNGGFSSSLSNINTVLGPKPSGLLLTRKEDSYLGTQRDAELFGLPAEETRAFVTPSITGSHFDELKDNNDKIINFSCSSATTGDGGTSTLTSVSSLTFSPVDNFYNPPIITSNLIATEDDKGKTFIVSGASVANTASSNPVGSIPADVLNITANDGSVETPIPVATITDTNDPVVVEDCSKVTIAGGSTNKVINLSTSSLSVTNGSVDSNAIIMEHDKIKLTNDDANITGVIDCSADLILPNNLSNSQHITFLNATNYETKVLAENSSHTVNSKLTDYIPPKAARKFTYNNNNWAASDIEVVSYNQLNLTSSHFASAGNTIVHNEDVDIKITGTIASGRYVNVVRNQIENFNIEGSREDWITPVMRIFINGVLKYTAPSNSLGTRIKFNGSDFEFKDIKPIVFNEVSVSNEDFQGVYSYSGQGGSIDFKFASDRYDSNFEIFVTSKKDVDEDVLIGLSSDDESVKFVDKYGDEIGFYYNTPLSKERVISIRSKNQFTFVIEELDQSDRYKFDQPSSTGEKVIVNRSEDLGLELPTINDNTYDHPFDLVFCNLAKTRAKASLPAESSSRDVLLDISEVAEFSSTNFLYDKSERKETDYNNFVYTNKTQNHSQDLSDGDFVVLDGSVDNVYLESAIKKDIYTKKEHKYSQKNMETMFNAEGEFIEYLSFSTNKFNFKNHGLTTYQKLTFNCEKVIVADHYYAGDPDDYHNQTSPQNPQGFSDGDSVLCYLSGAYYFTYYRGADYKLIKTNFDYPYSFSDVLGLNTSSRKLVAGDVEVNRLFAYIKGTTKMYDFFGNKTGLSTETATEFSLTISADDDSSESRKQTYFVKVLDGNNIELYLDSALSTNERLEKEDSRLTDTFYVNNIDTSSLDIVNNAPAEAIKTFSDNVQLIESLEINKTASLQQHYSNVYTSGSSTPSGVHYVTGYTEDGSTDTCSVESLQGKDTVFLSGKFHAKADLSDSNFDGDYYINAGLSKVAISNTNNNAKYEIKKNRVAKHTSGGTFVEQDQNSTVANASDIIYYPKNELHVLDRKYLSKTDDSGLEHNFIFFKPDEHSDDLKIVLPNNWANLEDLVGSNGGKVAVVNLHDRPVRVENFNNTTGFTLNSDSVAFINDKNNYGDPTNHTLFNVNEVNGYTFDIDEDSKIAKVTKGSTAEFFIMKPGDIIIDHSIHHNKKILVDGDINFLRPYVSSNIGDDYGKAAYDENTKFFISNISKEPINVNINYESADSYGIENLTSEGKLHSSKFYTAELAQFAFDDDSGEYFTYIEIEQDTDPANTSDDFVYSSADLNSEKKYNIFGIQCPITIGFYYEGLSVADSKKINDYLVLPDETDFSHADESIYKIMGVGEEGLVKLNLVNTVYEDVSVTAKGYDGNGGAESAVLSSHLQSFINEKIIPSRGAYRSFTHSGGRFDKYYDQDLTPALLPKNKALQFSVAELLSPNFSAYNDTGFSAFYINGDINLGDIGEKSEVEVYQSNLVNVDLRDAKLLKIKESKALFSDSSVDGEQKNRAIISVADNTNISLPRRKLITRDFDFIIINGSRDSIQITSPEGSAVFNTTLASGKFIKISYASNAFASSGPSDCTVVERGIYRKDLKAFTVTRQSSSFIINNEIPQTNIINNSGANLGLKLIGSSQTLQVDKDKHMLVSSAALVLKNKDNVHRLIKQIKDGTVNLDKGLYEKQAILFNDQVIRSFSVPQFFSADFIPFISSDTVDQDRKSGIPSVISMSFNGFSIMDAASSVKNIPAVGPISFSVANNGSTSFDLVDIGCRLDEFRLSQANDKILLPKKNFDYILDKSANISLSLYNRFDIEGNLKDTNVYKFNLEGTVDYDADEDTYRFASLSGKNLYNITQAGEAAVGNITKKQSYVDLIRYLYNEDILDEERTFLRRFYCGKSLYANKSIVFKDPFEVEGTIQSGTVFLNVSGNDCLKEGLDLQLSKNSYVVGSWGAGTKLVRPKYSITPNASKVFILTHNADVEVASVDNLKIANISNGEINVKYSESNEEDELINYSSPVYSCERADFTSSTDITYSEIRKQRREDWFIKLTDLDIPHLIEDPTYFDEKEWQMERTLEKRGINVQYEGARYKFSNIFNTNKNEPKEGQTGFQTIEDYNDAYKFGVTFFSNQRGVKRDVFFKKDISSMTSPMYLKIPWDMKQDIIAYGLNTGHERITKCSHFNERTGEITLSGFKPDRYHSFESEEVFDYDFVYDLNNIEIDNFSRLFNKKEYEQKDYSEEVTLTYNGEVYGPGEKIKGVGLTEYKLNMPYHFDLKFSQYGVEDIDDSAEDASIKSDEKTDFAKIFQSKIDDPTSAVKSPAWSKVSLNEHRNNFLNAVVEEKVSSGAAYELIQGRKIKNIEGRYINEVDKKGGGLFVINEYEKGNWHHTRNFEFTIPLLEGTLASDYTIIQSGDEKITIEDKVEKVIRVRVNLVGYKNQRNQSNIESPAYEYKIKSSLKLNSAPHDLIRLSIEDKDSAPFAPDGVVRSLNEDFSSAISEEQSVKAMDRIKARYEQQSKEVRDADERLLPLDEYMKANQIEINQRNHKAHLSLKNNHGYSFVPFGVHSGPDPMVGFRFNLNRDKASYSSVRFRLKKLTNKKIVFNDLTKDAKIGTYLTNNTSKAKLRYILDSELESISYQDIARPGGVAKLNTFGGWNDIEATTDNGKTFIRLNNVDNGDAIVFKHDAGTSGPNKIKAGRVYFLRIFAVAADGEEKGSNLYEVLNVFDNDERNTDLTYDAVNIIDSAGFSGNKYKIVNYFNLQPQLDNKGRRVDGYRGQNPVINKIYDHGIDDTQYTSLNFPIIVNNKRFYLERPSYKDYSVGVSDEENEDSYESPNTAEAFATTSDNIYTQEGNVFSVRANLELSAVAEGLVSNESDLTGNNRDKTKARTSLIDLDENIYWHDLDIFASFKNILFRNNTTIDFVSIFNKEVRVVVKLTKGKEYRYILNGGNIEGEGDEAKILINGAEVSISGKKLDYFICENGEIEILYKYKDFNTETFFHFDAQDTEEFLFSDAKKDLLETLYTSIFITESAYYVDQIKKTTNDDTIAADYMDYQVPNLNNYNADSEHVLFTPSSFSYTENLDRLFSLDKKYELLRSTTTDHGLAYDGPLPATVKYIYPVLLDGGMELSFSLTEDHVKGFINGFEPPKDDGSSSFRNKPKSIRFNLQRLESGSWVQVSGKENLSIEIDDKQNFRVSLGASPSGSSGSSGSSGTAGSFTGTYRMAIKNETFQYYDEGVLKHFRRNELMRLPFDWRSVIRQSDIGESVDGIFSLDLAENHLIGNSISIPKEGVSLFGCHEYSRVADNYDINIPHERLYKYRLSHRLKASYVDKIAVGGISKVVIESGGSDYRVAPDIVIEDPEPKKGLLTKTSKAIAHIESGKVIYVEVSDSGAGYSDVSSEAGKQKVIDRAKGDIPFVFHSMVIQDSSFTHTFNLTNNSKLVNHDGQKNIILGARVSGTGVPSDTRVEKINSLTQFTLSKQATATQASSISIDYKERQMPYISLSEHKGVKTADVTVNNITEDTGECQENFGILADEAEALAEYVEESFGVDDSESAQAIADFKTTLTKYVNTLNAVSESDNWNTVEDIERKIKAREDSLNERNIEIKDTQSYAISTEDEYSDLQGTESSKHLGLYEADEREATQEISVTIKEDGSCEKEVFPEPTKPVLTAIVNNNSIAEYRVVKNEIANKSQPWLSSFSREQNPSLPKGFGINPTSPVTGEVFNNYVRTINNMRFLGAYVPVFAKVRKYRKYEYRYVEDMANMTFSPEDPSNAGEEIVRINESYQALTYEALSKQNFIDFYDHKEKKYKRAWFSGFKGLQGQVKSNITKATYDIEEFKTDQVFDANYIPKDIGLPNKVNIPEENGVFCFPASYGDVSGDSAGKVLTQEKGLDLPNLNKRRAFAFGGELVYTSEEYDITSETMDTDVSIVNIAGSEIIDTSYENEIIFGCQISGKPFWSTFLKTTIEWTEFEIVPSPSFLKSAVGEDGLGKIENINGTILQTRGICKNEKIGTVDKEQGYHSLCTDGDVRGGTGNVQSYEEYFGLADGDDIIGPSMQEFEFSSRERIDPSAGKQTFKIEPEFTQALAVYGTNKTEMIVRRSDGLFNQNFQAGPCVHKCSPFGRKVFMISDEQLRFDLMKNG